jgi:hypothetical protein
MNIYFRMTYKLVESPILFDEYSFWSGQNHYRLNALFFNNPYKCKIEYFYLTITNHLMELFNFSLHIK